MNEPVVPPPPGAEAPAKKKGLSPLAWFAIGCGALILLGLGSCFVMTAFVANKVKKTVEEFADNPDAAIVKTTELMLRANPELDVVASDPAAGTITVREKATGKEVTFTLADIKAGRISVRSGDEETSIDFSGDDTGGGTMKITSERGTMVFGGGDGSQVPSWIPSYPGARSDAFANVRSDEEASGSFSIHTADGSDVVLAFFEQRLRDAGFEVEKTTIEKGGALGGTLTARSGGRSLNVTVAMQEGETQGLISYAEKR